VDGAKRTIDEVGNAALFLANDLGGYCPGITLPVSCGMEIGYGLKEAYPDSTASVDAAQPR